MSGMPGLAFELSDLSSNLSWTLPFLGVVLITVSLMMGIRKRRRRSHAKGTARDRVEELKQHQAVRGDFEQLMVEVEQLSKRFGAQLDAKTVQMERLIEEAEQKIAELKQLEQARQATNQSSVTQASSSKPQATASTATESSTPDDTLKRSVCGLADQGHDPIEIARRLNEHVGKVELILALRKT
jgi:seryl-tRNA synthetase